jgi:hypothetical protein
MPITLLLVPAMKAYTTGLKSDPGMSQYQTAVGLVAPTSSEIDTIDTLEIATWGNIALCQLKLGNGSKALENAEKVFENIISSMDQTKLTRCNEFPGSGEKPNKWEGPLFKRTCFQTPEGFRQGKGMSARSTNINAPR